STTELRVMEIEESVRPSPSSTRRNSSTRASLSLARGSQASVGSTWSTPSSLTWRSWEAQTLEEASTMGVPSEVVLPNESMLAPIGQFSAVNIVVLSWGLRQHYPIGRFAGENASPSSAWSRHGERRPGRCDGHHERHGAEPRFRCGERDPRGQPSPAPAISTTTLWYLVSAGVPESVASTMMCIVVPGSASAGSSTSQRDPSARISTASGDVPASRYCHQHMI